MGEPYQVRISRSINRMPTVAEGGWLNVQAL
jgi:hypothetical protein